MPAIGGFRAYLCVIVGERTSVRRARGSRMLLAVRLQAFRQGVIRKARSLEGMLEREREHEIILDVSIGTYQVLTMGIPCVLVPQGDGGEE